MTRAMADRGVLSPVERRVIAARFGFGPAVDEPDLSRHRLRQVESTAIEKLRVAATKVRGVETRP